jgi:transposase
MPMILDAESWMNIRRFRALRAAGATYAEIAAEVGCDWRTVKKYLDPAAPSAPPRGTPRRGSQPRRIDPLVGVVEAWLRADITLRGSVIHERLVAEYGYDASYQRVKVFRAEARPRIAAELAAAEDNPLAGLHRRFEVVPGAQAQVDWGDEGAILAHAGVGKVYSFHMVLSYSRDPFICYTTSTNAAIWWDCHRRAFAHFGGVPAAVVYDRTKTIVKRHVRPGQVVPLHPDAAAFADHYGFIPDVLAAYRPTGKGRVERQVHIGREHVLAGRSFTSIADMDAAFLAWLPIRRGQVHRTHGEVIAVRAETDRAALGPVPALPYLVADRCLRRVGKDCLVSFEASLYSVPAARVRAGQPVEIRAGLDTIAIHALPLDTTPDQSSVLATHGRAGRRGSWVVDPAHWDGLPDGRTRAVVAEPYQQPTAGQRPPTVTTAAAHDAGPLAALLTRHAGAAAPVARRPLEFYDGIAGLSTPDQPA